jgi:hypothetical protein
MFPRNSSTRNIGATAGEKIIPMPPIRTPASGVSVDEATLFAFDDVAIPFTHNLRLSMHQPRKHPANPVLPRGKPGMPDEFGAQFYGSILRDNGKFRMWYVAVDTGLTQSSSYTTSLRQAYAESDDGIHWRKPSLGLVEYRGNRDNNLVLVDPCQLGAVNLKVIHEPDDPDPSRRYKMTNLTWWMRDGSRGSGTLAALVSGDGLRWKLAVDTTPVDGMLPLEGVVLPHYHAEAAGGLYKWDGMYYATGQTHVDVHATGTIGRAVTTFRSPDFVNWSETKNLAFVREGQHSPFDLGTGEETHEGIAVWNRGNVLLGVSGLWHGDPEWAGTTIDLSLVLSNDGLRFREPIPGHVFLERGDDGLWDQGGLIQGQGFENVDDETYIYYGAWDPRPGLDFKPRGGLGLSTVPRDRLGSLSPIVNTSDASLVTSAVESDGAIRLWVNADGLSADTWLSIELLDAQERPLPGYSGKDAARVDVPGLRQPVVWTKGDTTIGATGKFKVRITFAGSRRGAPRLYAVYVGA